MKKYYSLLILALVATMGFTACSDDDDYQWATVSGNQVYFSNELSSSIEIPMSGSEFIVPISRVKTDEAITVNLAHTDTTGFYTVPSSVSFAAGETQANIVIGYDNTMMVYDKFIPDTIRITSTDLTSEYGLTSYAFSAGAFSPYKSIGKGTFVDNYYFGATLSCEILQNQEQKNVYRVMNPYRNGVVNASAGDDYLEITIQPAGAVYKDVTLTRNDLVTYGDFNTGYHHSNYDADIYLLYPSRFSANATEESWSYNRVVAWQEDGTPGQVQLAPYYYMFGVGGWNASQGDGNVYLYFPGFVVRDFSIEADFMGVLTAASGEPSAAIDVALGADATDVRAAVVSDAADEAEVAAQLLSGELEATALSDGTNFIPIAEGLTGKLKVVAIVVFEGEVKDGTTVGFEYFGGAANPWETVATGDYIYTLFFGSEDNPQTDPGLELQYNADDDIYRITHWGYDVDFSFTWDRSTNKVHVPSQFTGYVHSSYGEVYIAEADDQNPAWEVGSSFYDPETLTFYFGVAYYVSAGVFGRGFETYTLSAAEARALGLVKKQYMPAANASIIPVKAAKKGRINKEAVNCHTLVD